MLNKDDVTHFYEQSFVEFNDENGIACKVFSRFLFAKLVAEQSASSEREACAKICENIYTGEEACGDWPTPEMCAEAIRARGQAT